MRNIPLLYWVRSRGRALSLSHEGGSFLTCGRVPLCAVHGKSASPAGHLFRKQLNESSFETIPTKVPSRVTTGMRRKPAERIWWIVSNTPWSSGAVSSSAPIMLPTQCGRVNIERHHRDHDVAVGCNTEWRPVPIRPMDDKPWRAGLLIDLLRSSALVLHPNKWPVIRRENN